MNMRSNRLLRFVFVVFFTAYGLLFMTYVMPLISAEYGEWAGTVSIILFVLFALGCGYGGMRFKFK